MVKEILAENPWRLLRFAEEFAVFLPTITERLEDVRSVEEYLKWLEKLVDTLQYSIEEIKLRMCAGYYEEVL